MPPVQTVYSERIGPAYEGQVANETNWDGDTRTVETAAGIGFGKAVSQGAADKGAVLGGTVAGFVGVSIRSVVERIVAEDKYAEKELMGVLTEGDIWLKPAEEVNAGDEVWFDGTTGVFYKQAGSGRVGPIPGARWMTSNGGADALAVARFGGQVVVE